MNTMLLPSSPADPTAARDEVDSRVAARLRERSVRYTLARRLVVDVLAGASGPLAASDLHAGLADQVPLSSLYRTLTVLDEAGVLDRYHDAEGLARYELAEWLTGHHHHLVCVDCGDAADVDLDPPSESRVRSILERLAADAGFEVSGHRIDIQGKCRKCRSA